MLPNTEPEPEPGELKIVEDDPTDSPEKPRMDVEQQRAAYRADLRSYVDRRQTPDRRDTIRFENDRRQYIRRTEDRAWRLA